ncbi:MAG: VTT domain-containing protein [Candidatus Bathyarchaeia archaeon]
MRFFTKALAKIIGAAIAVAISLLALYDGVFLKDYGLLGVFLAALLSHLSIIARGAFLPALFSLTEFYGPVLLGLTAGLGGALGEVTAYYWGSGIRDAFNTKREKDNLPKLAERYGLIILLLFASSPLPDTPIVLLAGSLRLPLWKVISIQVIGKTILYLAGAHIGCLIFMELKSVFDYEITSTILLVASFTLCILVSWRKSRDKILRGIDKIITACFKAYGR